MFKFVPYISLLLLLFLLGCGKSQFILDFVLSGDVTDTYNVTYFATDSKGGITVQAVASVREGKCELAGFTKRPTLVYLSERKSKVPNVIFANKGEKIKIYGSGSNPLAWKVEGNEINNDLSLWRDQNLKYLVENNPDSINKAVSVFVESNPENPASTILMLCYYHRYLNEKEYASLMYSLKGEAKSQEWLRILGRSDQMYHSYSYPAALDNVVMRSNGESGRDTLKINHENPVIFFFWQTGESTRKDMVDSIKAIYKEFPDSSLLIADVCLDMDSVAWRNAIRRDSLDKVKRFWVPTGFADPEIHKFKVDAIPFFIVFDKEGHQNFRGKGMAEAISRYRTLLNTKDTI